MKLPLSMMTTILMMGQVDNLQSVIDKNLQSKPKTKFIDGPYGAAFYSKKRIGIGKLSEGAFCFVTPRQGDDFDEGLLFTIQLMKCSPQMYELLLKASYEIPDINPIHNEIQTLLKKARGEI